MRHFLVHIKCFSKHWFQFFGWFVILISDILSIFAPNRIQEKKIVNVYLKLKVFWGNTVCRAISRKFFSHCIFPIIETCFSSNLLTVFGNFCFSSVNWFKVFFLVRGRIFSFFVFLEFRLIFLKLSWISFEKIIWVYCFKSD